MKNEEKESFRYLYFCSQGGMDMQWLYVLLMFLVMVFTVYETVGYYREYKRSKTRRDQINFFLKIGVLFILIVLFVWMINQVIEIGTGMISI